MTTKTRIAWWLSVGALVLALGCAPEGDDSAGDVRVDGDVPVGADADADADGVPPPDGEDVDYTRPEVPDVVEEACDQEEFAIARVIPDMLIVLDRSNSMFDDGYWNPVREAIYGVTFEMDMEIWFGLMIFPNVVGAPVCSGTTAQCEPGHEPLVGVAEGTALDIRDALGPMATCGGTPIAQTLQNARAYLDTLAADGHPKFILLATDGAPNCNAALDGSGCVCTSPMGCSFNNLNCLDDARTMGIVEDIRAAGIQIFVLGIGTSEWMDILNEMAARGGTGAAFPAEDPASIRTAFDDIAGSIASCEFDMRAPDPSADPTRVNFYFDEVVVPSDNADGTCDDGWAWTDATHTRVQFCGSYCDRLLGGSVGNISATWGCPTVLI